MNIKTAIKYLVENKDLNEHEAQEVMYEIMTDKITPAQFGSFITALKIKGETAFEIAGMAKAMRSVSLKIDVKQSLLDTCGTGGSGLNWFNISTASAFVISGAGIKIAKHGNKAISGKSGSADVLSELGVNINLKPDQVKNCIEDIGIGFLFAQTFHPAMKFAGPLRPQIGIPTIFNFLGPLTNPAMVKNQLIGVFSEDYQERIVKILQRKNAETIMTVRSDDGMDELSTTSKNKICLLKNNIITNMVIDPQDVGLQRGNISDIQINTKEDAIKSFVDVLNDTANKTKIEITALNAAGGLIVSDIANSFDEAVELALTTIHSGKAFDKLKNFVKNCGDMEKLEEVERS